MSATLPFFRIALIVGPLMCPLPRPNHLCRCEHPDMFRVPIKGEPRGHPEDIGGVEYTHSKTQSKETVQRAPSRQYPLGYPGHGMYGIIQITLYLAGASFYVYLHDGLVCMRHAFSLALVERGGSAGIPNQSSNVSWAANRSCHDSYRPSTRQPPPW
ncbi:hypothetical protein OG21DRAFT_1515984, partial [Imleria badia]